MDGQYGGETDGVGCERLWNDMRALGVSYPSSVAVGPHATTSSEVQFEGIYADVAYGIVALHNCALESGGTRVQIRSHGHVGAYTGAWRAGGPEWS